MKASQSCHRDFFHHHHLKNTPARDVVFHLLEANSPITLDKLYLLVKKNTRSKTISFSTVFRIIEQFIKVGIVEKLSIETETTPLYQLHQANEHHHQLVCTKCKKIISISECPVDDLEKLVAKTHQFKVEHHQFTLYGLCQNCQ
jgi:Fur family transcriptional regulator, ferric uptake regulator